MASTLQAIVSDVTRVTPSALPIQWERREDSAGYLHVFPPAAEIARQAKCTVNELALAANIASEVGSLPLQYWVCVGEVARNEAAARGTDVASLLTSEVRSGHKGEFGEQRGRWAASSQKPNARHLAMAKRLLAERTNFTNGARKYFDGKVQDGGVQRGVALAHDAIGIVEKWYREGFRWTGIGLAQEIDPYLLMLFAKGGAASVDETKAAVADGRRRWKIGQAVAGGAAGAALVGAGAYYALKKG